MLAALPAPHPGWALVLFTGPLSLGDQEGRGAENDSRLQVFVLAPASGLTHICGLETPGPLKATARLLPACISTAILLHMT